MAKAQAKIPHIEWVDLYQDGMLHEVAIVKRDKLKNIHFIKIDELDRIDRTRLASILRDRNAGAFELWDLLSQKTLGNGMGALDYFHQITKVATPTGQIYTPNESKVGYNKQASMTPRPEKEKKAAK